MVSSYISVSSPPGMSRAWPPAESVTRGQGPATVIAASSNSLGNDVESGDLRGPRGGAESVPPSNGALRFRMQGTFGHESVSFGGVDAVTGVSTVEYRVSGVL